MVICNWPTRWALLLLMLHTLGLGRALAAPAGEAPWAEIPASQWRGQASASLGTPKRNVPAVVALPARGAKPLVATSADAQPAGLYEVRLTLRPSHATDAIALTSGLRVLQGETVAAELPGAFFAQALQPETRVVHLVQPRSGPLVVRLQAYADAAMADTQWVAANLKKGGPDVGAGGGDLTKGGGEPDLELELSLAPDKAVYQVVDKVEFRLLSRSGYVSALAVDKIRYLPGATLRGSATVADLGGQGGSGALNLYLEHGVQDRLKVKSLPVTLAAAPQTITFEVPLPQEELGYALVAEYVAGDGADHSAASAYFNIAANFQRVAIFGGGLATRDAVLDDATIRQGLSAARADYFNATEYFAWAEDDMVAMSPSTDFWSSGQTNYRMNKQTLQRQIALAHEQGLAVATYGKFVMSGLKGWETAYDYPYDHRRQYYYPVGMWEGVNVPQLDRRRDQDFTVYGRQPRVTGNAFNTWWSTFMAINPDATPRMARIAAEECLRSIDMFGWDAIRWDGHPRGGGQCGASGQYDQGAARQTQALVRYFKDIVAAKHPAFRHGYNYFLIEPQKSYAWAVEDYELDELCRGGGLLMNESIGNASEGYTFASIVRNLQVDGDLARERGGYYLGISFAKSPRDVLIESALWAAAGCRPYNPAMSREVRRYCTRYSQYTFDERLRRLATPEKLLATTAPTTLCWQPFVYETPLQAGKRQLVINLLNIPQQAKRPPREGKVKLEWDMPPAAPPATFALTLPPGMHATGASLLDPQTLAVAPLPLTGAQFTVPAVALWQVAVIDLAVDDGAPTLASLYGPPVTLGVPRPALKEAERKSEVVLDPAVAVWEVNKRIAAYEPGWIAQFGATQAANDALTGAARDQALLARRPTPESLIKDWWKGAALPEDLALKDKKLDFGDLTPRRDGRCDIYYARGAMDQRLRLAEAFAGLDRFRVHDAPLWGGVRQGPGMGLSNGVNWRQYPQFDVLVFTAIPHCAIGAENSYALPAYIKAGGAALFTGGEYAFGKGGYIHTVLERELLPVTCTEMQDTLYADPPGVLAPGPDFAELGVTVDFAAKPVFWVRNQVVLKPGAKVFLQSGGHPILVGWQLGQGRVACLLVDHRGKSENGANAFFDWQDWPRLTTAVLRWLAPDAGRQEAARGTNAALATMLLKQLQGSGADDALAGLELLAGGGAGDLTDATATPGAVELTGVVLQKRLALIDQALAAGDSPAIAAALAEQLAAVSNLPLATRLRLFDLMQRAHPANAAAQGQKALRSKESTLHGNGYVLLAIGGDPAFSKLLTDRPTPTAESEADAQERLRDLALAVAACPTADLVDEGRRRVSAWDRQELAGRTAFAKECGADTAMLDTTPYLDADTLYQRVAWLAYLSRHDAAAYGAPFAQQWLRLGEYQDYCARTLDNLYNDKSLSRTVIELRAGQWQHLNSRLATLRSMTQADVEALLAQHPAAVSSALLAARFSPEVRSAINLLGNLDRASSASFLATLKAAHSLDLAAFIAARQATPAPQP